MVSKDKVAGRWKNSKSTTKGIAGFTLTESEGGLMLGIQGAEGGFMSSQLEPVKVSCHSNNSDSKECIAFHGTSVDGGHKYRFAGNINKGLIIIATYITDLNDEDSNFFVREFFYKLK